MPRGTSEFKEMKFTESGVCTNVRSDGSRTEDVGSKLNEAFGSGDLECKELDDSMVVEKGKASAAGRTLHEHLTKPLLTGATFGASSYGIAQTLNKPKIKEERKKIRERARELAARDLQFELEHPRDENGRFRKKGLEVEEKQYGGAPGKLMKQVVGGFKPRPIVMPKFKPKKPEISKPKVTMPTFQKNPTPKSRKPNPKLRKLMIGAGLIGGGALAGDIASGNMRKRLKDDEYY